MKLRERFHGTHRRPARAIGWILLWALGVPLPILLLLYLLRGCIS